MKYPLSLQLKTTVSAVLSICFTFSIFAQFDPAPSIIINEVNYRTDTPGDFTEYIELHNTTNLAINLNGWFLNDAVNYQFPNVTIQANGYLIVAQDVADFNALFPSNNAPVVGPWTGALRNSGEDIVLRNPSFDKIDDVDYDNWNEWPSTGHGTTNLSIQKVNDILPGNHGGSWIAAARTPGAQNAVIDNNPNQRPIIKNVRRSPDSPTSIDDVRVRAEFDIDNLSLINGLQVELEYKVLHPGNTFEHKDHANYNIGWTKLPMKDDGMGADSTANNGVFTALIPASAHQHRRIVRYRVNVSNNSGFNATYPDQNYDESNYAYYVYNSAPAQGSVDLASLPPIQELTIFSDSDNTTEFIGSDTGVHNGQSTTDDFGGHGAVIYEGRVYDHINFRPRGGGSRFERVKPGIRIKMNREHSVETQNDCGRTYDVDRGRLVLSGGWVNDIGGHGLTESLIYKIIELVGGIERNVNYTQLRIVDEAQQVPTSTHKGDFWGLYLIMEDYNGDLIDERNQLAEGNFWNTSVPILPGGTLPRQRQLDYQGHFPDSELVEPWAEPELFNNSTGQKFMDSELDLEMMFADRIANVIYGQTGNNYIGKHSYREYYNSETGKHFAWWADMDNSFGGDPALDDNFVFTRDQCDPNNGVNNDIFVPDAFQVEYQNAMRCIYDLLLNDEQIDFLVDQERLLVHVDGTNTADWMQVDQERWGHTYDATTGPNPNTSDAHVAWYKQWFRDRAVYMSGISAHANDQNDGIVDDNFVDNTIPAKPTISLVGSNAIDQLDFTNSSFSDPQGSNTFGALEWRIAEWSDPSNPFYDTRCTPHYEIETVWESGEITNNNTSFNFDDAIAELDPGRTYKVRMRHKDNTGRWSHWSDPVTFIADQAVDQNVTDAIVISEIHYNPALGCAEFIEIHNRSNSTIQLLGYNFDTGVMFDFPVGSSIGPGEYKLIVEDEDCFNIVFGPNPDIIGEWSGGLSNAGEEVRLHFLETRLDSVRYDDVLPWDTLADNGLHSLALIDAQLDNNLAVNWATQCTAEATPGEANNFNGCSVIPDLSDLVINEIFYGQSNREFIELKNRGATPIDIQGLQVGGIELTILDSHIIPPGEFFILAKDTTNFKTHFQITTDQIVQYPGNLNDSGETITLTDFFGNLVDQVTYISGFPWPSVNSSTQSIGAIDCALDNNTAINWSVQDQPVTPLATNTFDASAFSDYSALVINEIHYVTALNDRAEFIELRNTGPIPILLEGLHFTNFTFTFSNSDVIFPNSYFVLAEYNSDFTTAFQFAPDASWEGIGGGLSSNGELIRIVDFFGNEVDRVNYNPSWDPGSDDGAHSLALLPNVTNNNTSSSWSIQCDPVTPKAPNNFDDDNDGVCNDNDLCPNLDDTLIGQPCNDGQSCTINDVYTNNCACEGTPTSDSDNDGVCDQDDVCPNFDDGLIGQPCNDGDDCTTNDVYKSNCNCEGTPAADSDNDGVCNVFDVCPNFNDSLIGLPCDDGTTCTPTTVYSNCGCAPVTNAALNGTASMSSTLSNLVASRLNDGVTTNHNSGGLAHTSTSSPNEWVEIDLGSNMMISTISIFNRIGCCRDRLNNAYVLVADTAFPNNTNLTQALTNADKIIQLRDESNKDISGLDINILGRFIRIQKSGNNSGGNSLNLREIQVFTPFIVLDSDNDGVCDLNDVCDNFNDNLIGASCNDNDPCTNNDMFTTNCVCEGTFVGDADNDGICDSFDQCPNFDDNLIGQPCDDGIICFVGSTWDANCNCSGGAFSDLDGDGTCDPLDECPGSDDDIDVNNNGIPDGCEGCSNIIVENSNSIISQDRSAHISITTNGRVFTGDIEYSAGQEINLLEDFEVKAGAVFHAYIAPCN